MTHCWRSRETHPSEIGSHTHWNHPAGITLQGPPTPRRTPPCLPVRVLSLGPVVGGDSLTLSSGARTESLSSTSGSTKGSTQPRSHAEKEQTQTPAQLLPRTRQPWGSPHSAFRSLDSNPTSV